MGFKSKISKLMGRNRVRVEIIERGSERRLSNHVVLVTGGSSGIGLSIAERFFHEGAKVIIAGRNEQKLIAVCEGKKSDRFSWIVCDMENVSQIESKLRDVVERQDVDILINNAGIYSAHRFLDIEESDWSRVVNTNLRGAFFAMQSFCRVLTSVNKTGRIINICSNTGILGATSCYSASKWGLIGLTRGLGKEMAGKGIAINGIAPGMVASPINGISPSGDLASCHIDDGRIAVPDEIAEIALFLASDASPHLVGQIIACDGGESLTCTYC